MNPVVIKMYVGQMDQKQVILRHTAVANDPLFDPPISGHAALQLAGLESDVITGFNPAKKYIVTITEDIPAIPAPPAVMPSSDAAVQPATSTDAAASEAPAVAHGN